MMKKNKQHPFALLSSTKSRKIALLLILVLLFFLAKKPVAFAAFIMICGLFSYYSALSMLPIEIGPFFFFEVVIARYFGLNYIILFAVLGYLLPKLMAGGGLKVTSYAFIPLILIVAYATSFFSFSLAAVGYASCIVLYFGEVMINSAFFPFPLNFIDVLDDLVNNLAWFLLFSNMIVLLLG